MQPNELSEHIQAFLQEVQQPPRFGSLQLEVTFRDARPVKAEFNRRDTNLIADLPKHSEGEK